MAQFSELLPTSEDIRDQIIQNQLSSVLRITVEVMQRVNEPLDIPRLIP